MHGRPWNDLLRDSLPPLLATTFLGLLRAAGAGGGGAQEAAEGASAAADAAALDKAAQGALQQGWLGQLAWSWLAFVPLPGEVPDDFFSPMVQVGTI